MIVIPIGQEASLRRSPYVTIGLMVLLTSIHFYTDSKISEQIERHMRARAEYEELLAELLEELNAREYDYADAGSMELPEVGNNYLASLRAIAEFHETQLQRVEDAMESGELYPAGSLEHDEWLEKKRVVRETEEQFLYLRFGFVPTRPSFSTMVTSMFFHGGWLHLIFNLIFLWAAGCMMESSWGHVTYSLAYLLTGIGAVAAHWCAAPQSDVPTIGASGAIAGMMGAYLVVHFSQKVHVFWVYFLGFYIRKGVATLPAYVLLGMWIMGQVFWAVFEAGLGMEGGIAYWAHIGGFGFGVVAALVIRIAGLEDRLAVEVVPRPELDLSHLQAERVAEARELYKADRGKARTILEDVLEKDSQQAGAHGLLTVIYADQGQFSSAQQHCERAIDLFCAEGEAQSALEAFEAMEKACPEVKIREEIVLELARTLENAGMMDRAAELCMQLAVSAPDGPLASKSGLRAGMLYEQIGIPGAAKQAYRFVHDHASDPYFRQEAADRLRALGVKVEEAVVS